MEEENDAIEQFTLWKAGELDKKLDDDTLICECMCVSVLDIREYFKDTRQLDLEILKEQLGMGQGCNSCLKSFEQWGNKIF